ncbi:BglG family transcription antiterminator [Amphibacillus sediminis]|uniref:BglG family transcription antiterminator n=1 Tax=Amphibacillus sediminis TaxID=360185 RepID=UPI000834AAC0|nr:PRD domain-containing protein [Amphibacillus sediminis]
MYISGRERKIIEELLTHDKGVTIEKLAQALDVSGRTIHRDLKEVELILETYQLSLNKKSGVGVSLEGSKKNKTKLALSLTQVKYTDYTPEERHAIILSTLLETHEPIKLFTLANELNVTVATVSHDLDKIEDILKEYKLNLIRRRGYGVKVEGAESSKRSALSHLIAKYVDELDFMLFIKENIEKKNRKQLDSISERLLGLVDQQKIVAIEKSIEHIRNELPYQLADSSYIGLVVHLALAIERLQQGDRIYFDSGYLSELKGTNEYAIAEHIIKDLQTAFNMTIPSDEIGYITMHLLGAKLRSDHEYLLEDSTINIVYYTKALIDYVEKELATNLSDHKSLFKDLVAHLKPTVYRLQKDMNINNPLQDEIYRDYQELFIIIKKACREVFKGIAFPDAEIAYLVLHFAAATIQHDQKTNKLSALVICSSGIGTSKMLASRIKQEIAEIDKIDNCSLFELGNIRLENYHIVISTIPLKNQIEDYVLVSPILTTHEIAKLKSIIKQRSLLLRDVQEEKQSQVNDEIDQQVILTRLERMQSFAQATLEILTSFNVYHIQDTLSKNELLKQACEQLTKQQHMPQHTPIYHALLRREQLGGLGIPNTKLTLFHTRHRQIKKPVFVIYRLAYHLNLKGMDGREMESDTLLFMFSPEESTSEQLEIFSFISGLIIQSERTIELFESGNQSQIKQYLSQQLNTFINENI